MRRRLIFATALLLPLAGCVYPMETGYGNTDASPSPIDLNLERSEVAAATQREADCASGEVVIREDDASVRITRDCPSVVIDGYSVVVTAEDVGDLLIRGYGAVFLAHSIESVEVSLESGGALVQWEVGQPTVTDESGTSALRKAG